MNCLQIWNFISMKNAAATFFILLRQVHNTCSIDSPLTTVLNFNILPHKRSWNLFTSNCYATTNNEQIAKG